jgi:glyoxylase-like metal-dependent hydrolase (beta-lactamase superfamily II)
MSAVNSSAARVAAPTAIPAPGTFHVTQRVTLLCATPGATIHYTTDGSTPSAASPVFDPYVLPVLDAVNQGTRGVASSYTIKALALKDGMDPSAVASFEYTIERRDTDSYISEEIYPGVHMITDYDDTKMYVVAGSERAMLIDAGLGNGNLRAFVEKLVGDKPLDVVISHGHPDHIAAMGQFQDHYDVYMNHRDLPMIERFIERMNLHIDREQIDDLREGMRFDLGDRSFVVYEVPGHSDGCVVLLDEASGLLIAGDAVGSNRVSIPDSLWMQFPGVMPIDTYLSALRVFRAKVQGKIKEIVGGHNDVALHGEEYLDNLERAAQLLVDEGEDVLVPSLRPIDAWQVVVGDRLTDANWAAINVAKGRCLSAPPAQIATLSNLQVRGAALTPGFTPDQTEYTAQVAGDTAEIIATTTSSRARSLLVNGAPVASGEAFMAQLANGDTTFMIDVTSPDGSVTQTYTLVVRRV